ncbi:zinc finger protein 518B [Pelodytes ibericus]
MNPSNQGHMVAKFTCEKCRFSTRDPNKYKNHVSLHNDIKFSCSHCSYISYTKGDFQRHLVTHTGKFPYTCEYCGYGAIRNDYIVKHIKRIHGDGKIQCSVSTVENEAGTNSINIIQTQLPIRVPVMAPNGHLGATEVVIDLTSDMESGTFHLAANAAHTNIVCERQVEVELISPHEGQLHPEATLSVIAPSTFKVPSNCIAEVLEVRPVNGTCHLILKYSEDTKWTLHEAELIKETSLSEQKEPTNPNKAVATQEKPVEHKTPCSSQGQSTSQTTMDSPTNTEQVSNIDHTFPFKPQVTKSTEKFRGSLSRQNSDNASHVFEGPFISSVFSLSSGSRNILEDIKWESVPVSSRDMSVPKKSIDTTNSTLLSGNIADQLLSSATTSEFISDVEKCEDQNFEKLVQNKTREVPVTNGFETTNKEKLNVDAEMLVPPCKIDCKEINKNESSVLVQRQSRRLRKQNTPTKHEIGFFTKPQPLFLSCNRNVVMQPLTCVIQNGCNNVPISLPDINKSITVDKSLEEPRIADPNGERTPETSTQETAQVFTKRVLTEKTSVKTVRKQSFQKTNRFKPKDTSLSKRLVTSTSKGTWLPSSRCLRLLPVKVDQLTRTPSYRQPVVVLNHPDFDSLETFNVMKMINKFQCNVLSVTLAKMICQQHV